MSVGKLGAAMLLLILPLVVVGINTSALASDSPALQFVTTIDETSNFDVIVDTRPRASCRSVSLNGAVCLPVEDVMAPNKRLANWSGMLWLLGTANLNGTEHVLVIGQQSERRQFMAGLLYLAGQKRVTVVNTMASELINNSNTTSAGALRATTRIQVYTAPMRSELIVLQADLQNLLSTNTVLLDGRSEKEYHGVSIRSNRGGHIPGASHSPLSVWQNNSAAEASAYLSINPVAYSHDAFESIGYFAVLQAAGVNASVYLAGWVEWATNGALPADSVSYPDLSARPPSPVTPDVRNSARHVERDAAGDESIRVSRGSFLTGTVAIAALLMVSFYSGRKFSGSAT